MLHKLKILKICLLWKLRLVFIFRILYICYCIYLYYTVYLLLYLFLLYCIFFIVFIFSILYIIFTLFQEFNNPTTENLLGYDSDKDIDYVPDSASTSSSASPTDKPSSRLKSCLLYTSRCV